MKAVLCLFSRDFSSLDQKDPIGNNQMALDVAEQELGIPPVLSSTEMASMSESDQLGLITYLSQFYDAFKTPPGMSSSFVCCQTSKTVLSLVFLFTQLLMKDEGKDQHTKVILCLGRIIQQLQPWEPLLELYHTCGGGLISFSLGITARANCEILYYPMHTGKKNCRKSSVFGQACWKTRFASGCAKPQVGAIRWHHVFPS